MINLVQLFEFQSTPSARRATDDTYIVPPLFRFQSTPSARRATCKAVSGAIDQQVFQSTPSARRATAWDPDKDDTVLFQSTPSARRATSATRETVDEEDISIHALREEGDHPAGILPDSRAYFNPRPPRGGRPEQMWRAEERKNFNPRPPRGGRRNIKWGPAGENNISIHALREEGDSKSGEKIQCFCSIIHTCAQFEKELYKGSGKMQNKSC